MRCYCTGIVPFLWGTQPHFSGTTHITYKHESVLTTARSHRVGGACVLFTLFSGNERGPCTATLCVWNCNRLWQKDWTNAYLWRTNADLGLFPMFARFRVVRVYDKRSVDVEWVVGAFKALRTTPPASATWFLNVSLPTGAPNNPRLKVLLPARWLVIVAQQMCVYCPICSGG